MQYLFSVIDDSPDSATSDEMTDIGFWIIEARNLNVVLRSAAAGSKAGNRRVEVRPFR